MKNGYVTIIIDEEQMTSGKVQEALVANLDNSVLAATTMQVFETNVKGWGIIRLVVPGPMA